MTTAQIESLANRESIANADFDVGQVLREIVFPTFYADVDDVIGDASWRRKMSTLSIVASTTVRNYDLAADFDRMEQLRLITTAASYPPLKYVGEDPGQLTSAEAATGQTRPTGYYIVPGVVSTWAVKLNTFPEAAYTAHYVYYSRLTFTDYTTDVSVNSYVPAKYQFALVHLLRHEIFSDRYGIGDDRASTALAKYGQAVSKMVAGKEQAPRNYAVFVD